MKLKLEKKWSDYLSDRPESGMDCHRVDVVFKDGTRLMDVSVLNSEEIEVPIPYPNREIVELSPHKTSMKLSIRMRIKPPVRRPASERLKSRLYYRRNRAKIRLQRKRYIRKHKSTIKHRKMFMRFKPVWFKKPSKVKAPSVKKFKVVVPKKVKTVFHRKPLAR